MVIILFCKSVVIMTVNCCVIIKITCMIHTIIKNDTYGLTTVLLFMVTAPILANNRPSIVAPVFNEID